MQSRLSHHPIGVRCASSHLALLPCGIVVTPSLSGADIRHRCDACQYCNSCTTPGNQRGNYSCATTYRTANPHFRGCHRGAFARRCSLCGLLREKKTPFQSNMRSDSRRKLQTPAHASRRSGVLSFHSHCFGILRPALASWRRAFLPGASSSFPYRCRPCARDSCASIERVSQGLWMRFHAGRQGCIHGISMHAHFWPYRIPCRSLCRSLSARASVAARDISAGNRLVSCVRMGRKAVGMSYVLRGPLSHKSCTSKLGSVLPFSAALSGSISDEILPFKLHQMLGFHRVHIVIQCSFLSKGTSVNPERFARYLRGGQEAVCHDVLSRS